MAEIGEVIGYEEGKLVIKLERTEACAKCKACTAGIEKKEMLIKAVNLCEGRIGDKVEIMLDSVDFYKATVIMYGIPFIMFMIGVFAGYYGALKYNIAYAEVVGIVLGLILVVITYLVIHSQEHRFKKGNYVPKAINVVERYDN
ncbi:MAG: SoxR reducing system RseC family protein [Lachnospirales bacterium]